MQEYVEEFNFDDPKVADQFIEVIRRIVQKEIRKLPYNKMLPATVVSVGSGVANIKLLDSNNVITNVKVRQGLSLSANDNVYVTLINGSLNNMFIDIRK